MTQNPIHSSGNYSKPYPREPSLSSNVYFITAVIINLYIEKKYCTKFRRIP